LPDRLLGPRDPESIMTRLLLSALTVLVLTGAAQAQPAPTVRPAPAAASVYSVYYRPSGEALWRPAGKYATLPSAQAAARRLYDKGYEVQIYTRSALRKLPKRRPTGVLPQSYTVTVQQADVVFRWLARQSDIAFRYPTDGCYARAHLMIRRMQRYGLRPYKVWTFANGEDLYARTTNHPRGYVTWRYHVAPILRVRFSDGTQRWVVIDPSLFTRPATITAWRNAQKRPGSGYSPYVTLTRLGQSPVDAHGKRLPGSGYWTGLDPREGVEAHAVATMRKYKPYEGQWPPKNFHRRTATAPKAAAARPVSTPVAAPVVPGLRRAA
jgi:hypothetical protein